MFRTVDALGAHFDESMQFDGRASKNINISNMTLAYSGEHENTHALISLDNTINPKISNVEFTTVNTTTGFVSSGVGVEVRGSIGVDESTVICRDIEITDCTFNVLDTAIKEDGEVIKTTIERNVFSNLNNGIVATSTSSFIPCDILVSRNKFNFIFNEAISVSTSTNFSRVVSSENTYHYIGNQSSGPDQISYAASPIFNFNAPGNVSVNDHFGRANTPYTIDFYYNPIANANTRIINNRPYKYSSSAGTQNDPVVNIPLTGQEQLVVIEYLLSNSDMSRKGRLTLNISADGFASVSDYYNYSEVTENESTKIIFSTADDITTNSISLICSNFSSYQTSLEYTLDITV